MGAGSQITVHEKVQTVGVYERLVMKMEEAGGCLEVEIGWEEGIWTNQIAHHLLPGLTTCILSIPGTHIVEERIDLPSPPIST